MPWLKYDTDTYLVNNINLKYELKKNQMHVRPYVTWCLVHKNIFQSIKADMCV